MTDSNQPDRVKHRAEFTAEMSATPEQVWAAIATSSDRHGRSGENDKPIWPHCAGLIWPHPGC